MRTGVLHNIPLADFRTLPNGIIMAHGLDGRENLYAHNKEGFEGFTTLYSADPKRRRYSVQWNDGKQWRIRTSFKTRHAANGFLTKQMEARS